MPTDKKRQQVQELQQKIASCHIAIATDYRGLPVNEFTDLRRLLREKGIEYRVVKNRLVLIAADLAGKAEFRQLLEGPTGIVFGYGDPLEPAKVLDEYIKANRSALGIRAAVMEGRLLTGVEVRALAMVPSMEHLMAQLLAQIQAPLVRLVNVLSTPARGLATVLQRRIDQLQSI